MIHKENNTERDTVDGTRTSVDSRDLTTKRASRIRTRSVVNVKTDRTTRNGREKFSKSAPSV